MIQNTRLLLIVIVVANNSIIFIICACIASSIVYSNCQNSITDVVGRDLYKGTSYIDAIFLNAYTSGRICAESLCRSTRSLGRAYVGSISRKDEYFASPVKYCNRDNPETPKKVWNISDKLPGLSEIPPSLSWALRIKLANFDPSIHDT